MASWMGAMVASAVLNGICQGLILTVLVWLTLRALPRTSAATRYGVWLLTLAFVVAVPVADRFLPVVAESGPAALPVERTAPITLPAQGNWTLWILAAWAVVALLLMARVVWSYGVLQRIKARATRLGAQEEKLFDEVRRACPGRRHVMLRASGEIAIPLAAGLRQPAVLLPAYLAGHLSEAELRDILAHELAHLRRWDDWTNLAQRLLEAVFFFHPAVLWIGRRLRLERELACDDRVVALSGTVKPYAACLTKLAALVPAVNPQLAPGAVARKPQLSIRVEALLARTRNGAVRISKPSLALASAALAVAGLAALPVEPVGVADPPVPVIAARPRIAPAPTLAAAVHPAPRPAVRHATSSKLRTVVARRGSMQVPAEMVMARSQAPAVTCYVVWLPDGEPGWIQIIWLRPARPSMHWGHA